jgi:hypothetical protein
MNLLLVGQQQRNSSKEAESVESDDHDELVVNELLLSDHSSNLQQQLLIQQLLQSSATTLTTCSVDGISILDQNGLVQVLVIHWDCYRDDSATSTCFNVRIDSTAESDTATTTTTAPHSTSSEPAECVSVCCSFLLHPLYPSLFHPYLKECCCQGLPIYSTGSQSQFAKNNVLQNLQQHSAHLLSVSNKH